MFNARHFVAAPALVLLMGGTAHAALTADQVWKSWQDGAALAGLTITAATEANSGGVLTLNGVTIAPEGASNPLTISDLVLTEKDGTVEIVPGQDIGITEGTAEEGFKAKLTHEGLVIVASEGDDGAIIYDFSADTLNVAGDGSYPGFTWEEGKEAQPVTSKGSFALEGLEGSYSDAPGDNRTFDLALAASKLVYDFSSDDPNMPMKTASVSETVDVDMTGQVVLPSEISLGAIQSSADFGTALQQGFAVSLKGSQGETSGSSSQEDAYFPYSMTMTSEPGTGEVVFNKDVFRATSASGGAKLTVTTAMAPAPIDITMEEVSFDLLSPVMSAEAASDYLIKLNLSQLVIGEGAWNLFDPESVLARDPVDLNIDVSGKAKVDWIAMATADETGAPPVLPQPESLDITDISLNLAGAAAKAVGAFTFDNSMGMPAPLGTADVTVQGANQLIDGLIKLGFLTEDDAMGARMMMAAFMKPGADPDTLESKIEAKEGFQIFVNGQQIQ